MALARAVGFPLHTEAEYKAKKATILSSYDRERFMRVGDDLLCKRCKQSVLCDLPERNFITRCNCRCAEEAWERRKRAERDRGRAALFRGEAGRLSTLGGAYSAARFINMKLSDAEDGYLAAAERCERFCVNFDAVQRRGFGIWLWGGEGVGKTHFGACMLHLLEAEGRSCLFTTAEHILDEVMAGYKSRPDAARQAKDLCKRAEVLFVDRFDETVGKPEGAMKAFSEILRDRLENLRPTVVMARISMTDYAAQSGLDEGVMDSLAGRMVRIRLVGKNRFCTTPDEAGF